MRVLPHIIGAYRYAVVDVETTGLSTKTDEVVQISISQVDCGTPRMRTYCTVRPNISVKTGAARVHGLSDAALSFSPRFENLAQELTDLIGDRIVLGYHLDRFDVPILSRQFNSCGFSFAPPTLDVFRVAKKLLTLDTYSLAAVITHLNVPPDRAHDALSDCRMTWGAFVQLATRFPDFGRMSLGQVQSMYA